MKPVNPDWPHEEIRRQFHYDLDTGVVTKIVTSGRNGCWPAGRRVGCISPRPKTGRVYRMISVTIKENARARHMLEHRFIWFYMTGSWPKDQIDHINGDGTDNRWCNLRESNQRQNLHNTRRRCDNTSGVKGVTWCEPRQCWLTQVLRPDGSRYAQGFTTKAAAANAYAEESRRAFGEFARVA